MMDELARAVSSHDERGDPAPDEFRLLCRRAMNVYNTSFSTDALGSGQRYNPAYLHPADIERLGLAERDRIEIVSERASILGIVHADSTLRRGLLSMSFGCEALPDDGAKPDRLGSNPARLLVNDGVFDRYSGQPLMTAVPVRIQRHSVAAS